MTTTITEQQADKLLLDVADVKRELARLVERFDQAALIRDLTVRLEARERTIAELRATLAGRDAADEERHQRALKLGDECVRLCKRVDELEAQVADPQGLSRSGMGGYHG